MIDIVIPIREESEQLEKTLKSIESFTNDVETKVHIIKDKTVNVSEARQRALEDDSLGRYILYMDDDSEIIHDNWVDHMLQTMQEHDDAGAVFGGEWWGTEPEVPIQPVESDVDIRYGPAACMLIDRSKLTPFIKWDQHIGLRNTWLGGDFEEVDFCYRINSEGLKCYRSTNTLFHHTGGKTTLSEFTCKDRHKTVQIMTYLLTRKYAKAETAKDEEYFKDLRYVKADPDDMDMLLAGESLRMCYDRVVARNGLQGCRFIKRFGLI